MKPNQPEALRLADILHYKLPSVECLEKAAAELRRLQSRAEVQDAALTCLRIDFRECALRAEKAEAEVERLQALLQQAEENK